jgi:hypothetical protein
LGFTTALCSESDGGSTSNVLMLILCWNEKMIRSSMYLPPNARLIHKANNRLTLITVFCFTPSLLWRRMKPKNWSTLNAGSRLRQCCHGNTIILIFIIVFAQHAKNSWTMVAFNYITINFRNMYCRCVVLNFVSFDLMYNLTLNAS